MLLNGEDPFDQFTHIIDFYKELRKKDNQLVGLYGGDP